MRLGLFLLALSMALPAWAADKTTLVVSRQDCKRLVRHQPAASAEYNPGTDVRGRKVKPAETDDSPRLDLPKDVSFDLNYDLAAKYGLSAQGIKAEPALGKVTVQEGGRVLWNGKPLGKPETAAVEDACRKAYGKR
ncbi:MAG: hypothetical protein H7841_11620 [Magnetospirillum sp. WYHS-4]